MSKRLVLIILGCIFFLNLLVVASVLVERRKEDNGETQTINQIQDDNVYPQKDEEDDETSDNDLQEENLDNQSDENLDEGQILDTALFDENEEVLNEEAIRKSEENSILMDKLNKWIATNYAYGDIATETYEVQRGDTLWEISEAYYGQGRDWEKILELNEERVGYLPNGSHALIVPGQVLRISNL